MSKVFSPEKRWIITAVAVAGLIGGALLFTSFMRAADDAFFLCSTANARARATAAVADYSATPIQLEAIVHYATSRVVPQQNMAEISISFSVLKRHAPCNFLVFGLGRDSLMWASLNPRGKTLFLEEDLEWFQKVTKDSPMLRAHHVRYRTQLQEADALLSAYRSQPECLPSNAFLRGNDRCKLALTGLPEEFYDTEWDLIMIDAPKGYFPEAPGRMAAIFSAAVMARHRRRSGVTHVFLHDVDRRIEKVFAEEFLCRKYRVGAAGRLWHFAIPAAANSTDGDRFC
ncbi:PREDICTED: probable methyltransferase At1g27930 [Tarenaya hassleriana]|uniref:probable methyltransferase At1g27930 n=1 Tax=Tarenaya hassleriana TaxID=28532 RepID=UPI00053C9335|nr:PREDICTED: probable methyltransferase At1g27930 [Tarenaya hassleriana]